MKVTKDIWIVAGILAVMITVAVLLVYRGQGKRLDEFKARISATRTTVGSQSQTVAIFPELVKQVKSMRTRYQNFDRRLPGRQELGGFLKEISGYLGDDHFSDQLIEPGSPTREELFHTLPIIMRFKGSYLTSVKFFKRIEEMQRITTNNPKEKNGVKGDPMLDIELQLNIYFTEKS